ncbi:MAG: hypothetical protein ACLQM6_00185 [Acidobacteriaceae bacterium]
MNYFNYFTEIETHFQQRRGSLLMLSTLDWALIETWREAGIPLEAVLRGIDAAFDKHDTQSLRSTRRQRKVNGLAWCAQAVLEAVKQSREAAIGAAPAQPVETRESGFETARIRRYLERNAAALDAAAANLPAPAGTAAAESAVRLRDLSASLPLLSSRSADGVPVERFVLDGVLAEGSASPSNLEPSTLNLEELDRTLTVLEEKLFAALLTSVPEAQLVALREQATRELAPYRSKMQAVQIKHIQQQFLQKRLLEAHSLPRLSLFYMPHEDQA